jgi:hypothetical protein
MPQPVTAKSLKLDLRQLLESRKLKGSFLKNSSSERNSKAASQF